CNLVFLFFLTCLYILFGSKFGSKTFLVFLQFGHSNKCRLNFLRIGYKAEKVLLVLSLLYLLVCFLFLPNILDYILWSKSGIQHSELFFGLLANYLSL